MKRVVVTGASGFVGRQALAPLLARGYEVHAVSRAPGSGEGATWHQADVLDARATRALIDTIKPTHLLHAAWSLTPGKYLASLDNLAWLRASTELFEAFAGAGGRHAAATGTCFEYDWSDGVCTEETRLAPTTLYGASKAALQQVMGVYARQAGFTLAWARLFFLYGPHEHPSRLVASVVRSLLSGEPARCSHGNQLRDYLHVGDAASAVVAVLDTGMDGPVNIGSGEQTRLKDLIYRAADLAGHRDQVQLGAVASPPGEPPLIVADVSRLREIGWRPGYDLESGVAQTVNWWRLTLGRTDGSPPRTA